MTGAVDPLSPASVGTRLRAVRVAEGLSPSDMADALGVDRSAWSRYERGRRLLTADVAVRVSRRYGVTLDYLLLGREDGLSVAMAARLRAALSS